MTRHSDPAPFSEAEVTLVDHNAGHQWDLDDDYVALGRPTEPSLTPPAALQGAPRRVESTRRAATVASPSLSPAAAGRAHGHWPASSKSAGPAVTDVGSTLTADGLRQQRAWKRGVTDARRSLAARRDQREALSRVLAAAKPRSQPTPGPMRSIPRVRAATQNP